MAMIKYSSYDIYYAKFCRNGINSSDFWSRTVLLEFIYKESENKTSRVKQVTIILPLVYETTSLQYLYNLLTVIL